MADMTMATGNTTNRRLLQALNGSPRQIGLIVQGSLACFLGAAAMLYGTRPSFGQVAVPTAVVEVKDSPAESKQAAPLLLGPGDLVDIEIFNTPELSGKVRIDQQGVINLPIGEVVDVKGLTPQQAGIRIGKALKDAQVLLDPHVNVFVLEYATQGVTVLGEVRSPGTYNLLGPHSLYDAISVAGGTTATAGATITVTHRLDPNHPLSVPVNSPNFSELQQSTRVEPGDTIVVSKAATIFVVGDVGHPGAFYLQNGEPLSVLDALALAAGLNRTAKVTSASIVRPIEGGAQTIPLNLDKIMHSKEPNPVLQASDVLVVPRSGLKVFLETALPGATNAVTGAVASALVLR